MKRTLFTLFVLALFSPNNLNAQNDSIERFVLLEYGLSSDDEHEHIKRVIDKKWGIFHKRVAGCVVTSQLIDSVKLFNELTYQKLTAKYGVDWENRYKDEIDEAYEKYMVVINRLKIDTIIRENEDILERVINNSDFTSLQVEIVPKSERYKYPNPTMFRNLQDDSSTILYRGFTNLFEINLTNPRTFLFHLECINCTISTSSFSDSLPIHQYYIKPKNKKEATLNLYSMVDKWESYSFSVHNLPNPSIYLNDVQNGGDFVRVDSDSIIKLRARYSDEVSLKSEFTVEKWELQVKDKLTLQGSGDFIDKENMELLKMIESGNQISIICTVKGPDGKLRKKAAAFFMY